MADPAGADGQRRVPEPAGEVSDVGPEHIALTLETKPEVVSFHFGFAGAQVSTPVEFRPTLVGVAN